MSLNAFSSGVWGALTIREQADGWKAGSGTCLAQELSGHDEDSSGSCDGPAGVARGAKVATHSHGETLGRLVDRQAHQWCLKLEDPKSQFSVTNSSSPSDCAST